MSLSAGCKPSFIRGVDPGARQKKATKEGCAPSPSISTCVPSNHRRSHQLRHVPLAHTNGRNVSSSQDGVEGGAKSLRYVPLEQARAMVDEASAAQQRETLAAQDRLSLLQSLLDNAVSEREELQRELRRSQEEAIMKEKKLKSATSERDALKDSVATLEKQLAASNSVARNASMHVAVKLEERIKDAFTKKHKVEIDTLQEQLKRTAASADKSKAEAKASMSAAELKVVKAVEEALAALEEETEAALLLAQMGAVAAREAAAQSSLVARTAVSEQSDTLKLVQSIRKEAILAHERGAAANAEADTLQQEVEMLREKLQQAHKQVAEAIETASSIQKDALGRVAKAEAAATARVAQVEAAYAELRKAEQQRAATAEETAQVLQGRVDLLTRDVDHLRSEISAAQAAMAQAESRCSTLEQQLNERVMEIQQQAENLLEDERKLLDNDKTKWGISNRDALLSEVDGVVSEVSRKLDAASTGNLEYLKSLHRAVQLMTKERDFYKRKTLMLEESLKAASVAQSQASKNGASDSGRIQALPKRRIWELFAMGTNVKEEPKLMDEVLASMDEMLRTTEGPEPEGRAVDSAAQLPQKSNANHNGAKPRSRTGKR